MIPQFFVSQKGSMSLYPSVYFTVGHHCNKLFQREETGKISLGEQSQLEKSQIKNGTKA